MLEPTGPRLVRIRGELEDLNTLITAYKLYPTLIPLHEALTGVEASIYDARCWLDIAISRVNAEAEKRKQEENY